MSDSSPPASLHAFLAELQEQLADITTERGLTTSDEARGYAFSIWVASLFMQGDESLRADLDDVVNRGGGDLGCDVVLTDDANRTLIIIQTKFRGFGKKVKTVDEDALIALTRRHDDLMSPEFLAHGNEQAKELLGGYPDLAKEGYNLRFYYVTTANATDRHTELVEKANKRYEESNYAVRVQLLDRTRLRDTHARTVSLERSIPDTIEMDLPAKQWFIKEGENDCLVAVLKGNELRNQYQRQGRRESLFAWNIRNYLGDRGINKDIKDTATNSPSDFVYFNNGVTAVCKDFEVKGNHLTIRKPQIINGAQTVASIAAAPANAEVYVLIRLIRTGSSAADRGLNSEIIKANNTQNKINLSDFRSNDSIQVWLEGALPREKATEVLGRVVYKPKRTARAASGGRIIALEELAKIRYAYLREPLAVHADPKSLWTLRSAGGRYEHAFGVNGEAVKFWSRAAIREAFLAIALHDAASNSGAEERKRDESLKYMKGLRFHATALAGIYFKEMAEPPSADTLLSNKKKFAEHWETIWDAARDVLFTQYEAYVAEGRLSLFAFKRSTDAWEAMKKAFRFKLKLKEPE